MDAKKIECKHELETREAYFPALNKKGKIIFCIKKECNYSEKIIN